jgi:hypothetical protein
MEIAVITCFCLRSVTMENRLNALWFWFRHRWECIKGLHSHGFTAVSPNAWSIKCLGTSECLRGVRFTNVPTRELPKGLLRKCVLKNVLKMLRYFNFDLHRALLTTALNEDLPQFLAHFQGSSLFFLIGIEGVWFRTKIVMVLYSIQSVCGFRAN